MSMKNSSDTIGNQPATLWLVARYVNQLRQCVPLNLRHYHNICIEILKEDMKNLRIVDIHTEI